MRGKPKKVKEKQKELATGKHVERDIVERAQKEIKGGNLALGNSPSLVNYFIKTGVPRFDMLLGGGIPRGKFTLMAGPYGAGKTFLAQVVIGNLQKEGGVAALIDAERSYALDWCQKSGVDTKKLIVSQPTSGEKAWDTVLYLANQGVDLIVLDSIAALTPEEEIEKGMEEFTIGAQARMVNRGLRKLIQLFTVRAHELGPEKNPAFIAINQVRAGIGGPITFESYPGGKGQQSFAAIIVRMHRGPWHQEGKDVGFEIVCKTEKNKLRTPFETCNLPFRFTGEIDALYGLIDAALNAGVIQQKGSYFIWDGQTVQGKLSLFKYITEGGLQSKLETEVLKKGGEEQGTF